MTAIAPEEIQKYITLEEVKNCFFEGALAGYAGGGGYKPSRDILGGKIFTLRINNLSYTDFYVSCGQKSGGMSFISLNYPTFTPLWIMQYDGEELSENKRIIKLLKEALLDAYAKRIFCGGRGQPHYPDDAIYMINDMRYHNEVDQKHNSFAEFSGRETVVKNYRTTVFYHNYSGGLLVPLE